MDNNNGFTVVIDGSEEDGATRYMVTTPTGKRWSIPEGGDHVAMGWNKSDIKRMTNAALVNCDAGCECCWDD